MDKIKKRTQSATIDLEKKKGLFVFLVFLLFCLFFSYIYFINQTVFNTASRQSFERELNLLSTKLGELEFEYISMKNDIDLEMADSLGFSYASQTKFVSRKPLGQSISLNSIQ